MAIEIPHFLVAPHIVRTSDVVLTVGERMAKLLSAGLLLLPPPLALPDFAVALFSHERNDADPAQQWFRQTIAEAARDI